jgi:rhodanese-related sulfurtransferase
MRRGTWNDGAWLWCYWTSTGVVELEAIEVTNCPALAPHGSGCERGGSPGPCLEAGMFVLDVRTAEEYEEGHIPGAYNISVYELDRRIDEIAALKNEEVLVYCRSGVRSANACCQLIDRHGFTNVHDMFEGFIAWTKAGYDTATPSGAMAEPARA